MKPDEAACPLMNCLLSLSEDELNRHNFFISNYPTQGYPSELHEKIKSKLAGAWSWLQGQGYLPHCTVSIRLGQCDVTL